MLPLSSERVSIFVAASPGNTVAHQLATALRQRGHDVTEVTSVAQARESAAAQACAVVLAGGESDDLIIRAAISAQCPILIPIVAPGQSVPRGEWTAPAVVYRGFMGEVIFALLAAVAHPLPPAAVPAYVPIPPEADPVQVAAKTAQEKAAQEAAKTKRFHKRMLYIRLGIVLLNLSFAGWNLYSLSHYHYTYHYPHSAPASQSYFAAVPGPCNQTQDQWYQGDSNDSYTCQANGLVMTQKSNQYVDDMWLNFDYQDHTTPAAYRVEVHADISTNVPGTCVGLSVHNADGGYGAQNFWACASGVWFVSRWTTTGKYDKDLAFGYLPRSTPKMDLRVDVIGSVMTLFVNGKATGTIVDQTYGVTNSLALDVTNDDNVSASPQATFSQFRYTPLFDDDQTIQSTLDAAQQQQQHELRQGYAAAVPGMCDPHGHAWWGPLSLATGKNASFQCQAHGLDIRQLGYQPSLTEATFYFHNGLFPRDYRTTVTLDMRRSNGGCAEVLTRNRGYAGYGYQICQDGSWTFYYYSAGNGHALRLASGNIALQPTYRLSVTDLGSLHTLSINGAKITTQQDGDFTDTENLALAVYNDSNPTADVVFSDFSYTPLIAQGS